MAPKLMLDSNKIFHKVFQGTKPGYDALQVDTFLDLVIKDYEAFEKYVSETETELTALKNKNELLNEKLTKAEAENASLNSRLTGISENSDASLNNLELLKRISALEKALSKAGINPNTIE